MYSILSNQNQVFNLLTNQKCAYKLLTNEKKAGGTGYQANNNCYRRQGSCRLEKYLNLEGVLEKSLKIKFALKSTGKSLINLENSSNFAIFYRT